MAQPFYDMAGMRSSTEKMRQRVLRAASSQPPPLNVVSSLKREACPIPGIPRTRDPGENGR